MQNKSSSSQQSAANSNVLLTPEPLADEDLLRGFELSLGASGRAEKTLITYSDAVTMLSTDLRAERSGRGDGRVYTIIIECTDSSGNASTQDVMVTVPHDQGNGKGKGRNR